MLTPTGSSHTRTRARIAVHAAVEIEPAAVAIVAAVVAVVVRGSAKVENACTAVAGCRIARTDQFITPTR